MRKLILTCLAGFLAWLGYAAEARAIGTLTFTSSVTTTFNGQNGITGSDYSPIGSASTISKRVSISTAAADAAVGGGDIVYSAITSISASSNASIDLTSVTDVMGTTGQTFVRVKSIRIRLLSATDDSVVGTAASSVTLDNTVTNALSAQSHSGWFSNAAEGGANGSKFDFPNGCDLAYSVVGAAGIVVDSTHRLLKFINNDGALTAKVQVTVCGGLS